MEEWLSLAMCEKKDIFRAVLVELDFFEGRITCLCLVIFAHWSILQFDSLCFLIILSNSKVSSLINEHKVRRLDEIQMKKLPTLKLPTHTTLIKHQPVPCEWLLLLPYWKSSLSMIFWGLGEIQKFCTIPETRLKKNYALNLELFSCSDPLPHIKKYATKELDF